MRTATPYKLRNGAWGCKVAGTPTTGEAVTITTKAGKTWTAEISRVLWTGNGVALCATAQRASTSYTRTPSAPTTTGCSRCRRTATRTAQIWEECDRCGAEPIYI